MTWIRGIITYIEEGHSGAIQEIGTTSTYFFKPIPGYTPIMGQIVDFFFPELESEGEDGVTKIIPVDEDLPDYRIVADEV
jgi:hypothetical protein